MEQSKSGRRNLSLYLAVAVLVFLAGVVVLADLGKMPQIFYVIYYLPYGDKVGHLLLMGLLAFALNLILKGRRADIFTISILAGTILAIVLVSMEEISQIFFTARSFFLIDLACSFAGILLSDLIFRALKRRH